MGTVHVLPADDLVSHEKSDECVCGPLCEFVPARNADEEDGWLYTHGSLDGRELSDADHDWLCVEA